MDKLKKAYRKALYLYDVYGFWVTLWKILLYPFPKRKANYKYKPLTAEQLEQQRSRKFEKSVKFSILTPLYNTKKRYIKDMIKSVQAQTYSNWELILADGSDKKHAFVGDICIEFASADERIKYIKLEKNLGIAGNTNACLERAVGDYISFLDHDDLLNPDALYETMAAICDFATEFIYSDEDIASAGFGRYYNPIYKPDFAPDYLRGANYICHFVSVSKKIVEKIGPLRSKFDGAQDYDFVLRATEQTTNIHHVPRVLYHWRAHRKSAAKKFEKKAYAGEAGRLAIVSHLQRVGLDGLVAGLDGFPGAYRVKYELKDRPLISIIIPNKDHVEDLKRCLDSIREKTSYNNYEIIIVENNSSDPRIFEYYEQVEYTFAIEGIADVKVIYYNEGEFNYSRINNFGADKASGKYIVFLNNDTQVITENWLEELLSYAQRTDVGVVGAKLYYNDLRVQHGGIVLNSHYIAGHVYGDGSTNKHSPGYMYRLQTTQNYSAVTAACMMINRDLFLEVGGFFEKLAVAYNDVDLCMKVRKKGLLVVMTPFCELYHFESASRGYNVTTEKFVSNEKERLLLGERWGRYWENGDPYYSVNFSKYNAEFEVAKPERIRKEYEMDSATVCEMTMGVDSVTVREMTTEGNTCSEEK